MSNQTSDERQGQASGQQAESATGENAAEARTGQGQQAGQGERQGDRQGERQGESSDKPSGGALEDMTLEDAFARLTAAEAEADQARQDLLRVQADMQNLRRRTEQDVEKAHKFALERFSTELLPVIDNLERARDAASDSEDPAVKAIHEGVELTLKSFSEVFRKFNIEAIDPHGEPFDPQLHQAMSAQESAEAEPDTVLHVMQKGYTLNGRVLRPAMVMVAKAPTGG